MKTKEEIKQKIAEDNGFDNWNDLLTNGLMDFIPDCIDEAMDLWAVEYGHRLTR